MPICGRISARFKLEIQKKLPIMMNKSSNFHFGENSVKARLNSQVTDVCVS